MSVHSKIYAATACAAVLGGIPAPTSAAITALQAWLISSIAQAHGLHAAPRELLTTPILAQTVGHSVWSSLFRAAGRSTPLGMLAGACVAGAATWALGRAAAAHFDERTETHDPLSPDSGRGRGWRG